MSESGPQPTPSPTPSQMRREARRRRRQRTPGRRRRAVLLLPNLVTTGALTLGFWSMTQSIDGRFNTAAWAIIAAGVLDTLDGRIARATNSSSRFGIEYDSLVDVICYGVAPAILLYVWALEPLLAGRAWPVAALFPICAALRLARFNAQVDVPRDHYVGIPSTAAGALTSVTYWFVDWLGIAPASTPWLGVPLAAGYVLLALLMVSPIPYPSWKSVPIVRAHAFSALVGVVLTLLLVLVNGEPALFLMALLYLASGPALYYWLRRQGALGEAAPDAERVGESSAAVEQPAVTGPEGGRP
jgi:CDP-diacylglycerol--serine O-phosphatidyltransferase